MLNEAVKNLKGEDTAPDFLTTVELEVDAYIPASYIVNEQQKLDIYKRIAGVETESESAEMKEELLDRFGTVPKTGRTGARGKYPDAFRTIWEQFKVFTSGESGLYLSVQKE